MTRATRQETTMNTHVSDRQVLCSAIDTAIARLNAIEAKVQWCDEAGEAS